jgi:hypothetical protein
MNEILGVEPGEVFSYETEKYRYMVSKQGYLLYDKPGFGWAEVMSIDRLTEIVNHPDRIIRKPRLTDGQIDLLKAAQKLIGARWMAKDLWQDRTYVYTEKPEKDGNTYNNKLGMVARLPDDSPLASLVSWDDPEPLNIEQTLRDAQ